MIKNLIKTLSLKNAELPGCIIPSSSVWKPKIKFTKESEYDVKIWCSY